MIYKLFQILVTFILMVIFFLINIISSNSLYERIFKEKHFIIKPSDHFLKKCESWQVCNKVDTYATPWIERQCQCGNNKACSISLSVYDGHTIADRTRQFKICENVNKLPICRFFRQVTWTLTSYPDNNTTQKVECICPKNSVAYIFKHQIFQTEQGTGYRYLFACSPESRIRCKIKEPCRLFTVKKRSDVEEVNTNTLCQCPNDYKCPTHHNHESVIQGTSYPLDSIKTYSGYCAPFVDSILF